MSTDVAALYDALAPDYQEYAAKRAAYLRSVDAFIRERVPSSARRLLDVGSGDGVRAMALARACVFETVVLSDVSAEMVRRCQALGPSAVWHAPAQALPDEGVSFDVITCLWNVLGHVPTRAERLMALGRMRALLAGGGQLFVDVQNRHNAAAYGRGRVLARVVLDRLWPDERRGDTSFDWKVGSRTVRGHGHLFTPSEIATLLRQAGFRIAERVAIDYATGERSRSPLRGQLVFVCVAAS